MVIVVSAKEKYFFIVVVIFSRGNSSGQHAFPIFPKTVERVAEGREGVNASFVDYS